MLLVNYFVSGVVTSPNHPGPYPNHLKKTHTIEVESDKKLRLVFTHFDLRFGYGLLGCGGTQGPCDYVKITDGDGTTLMSLRRPTGTITTRSHRVEIFFRTDSDPKGLQQIRTGWSLTWSAVTPGVKALF